MPGKMKIMNEFFHSCFPRVSDSKLKIHLYHEYFLNTLENIPAFLSLLSFSVLFMYVSMKRLYAAKFAAAFFPSSLFPLHSLQSV